MAFGPLIRATTPTHRPADDGRDLDRYLTDRDELAFAALVGRHGPAVFGVCRRMLGHHHDAEDAAQAVFVVLARNAAAIRRRQNLAAWLHGVAVRVCRKLLSRRTARPVVGPAPEPAVEPTWQDGLRAVDEALADLPDSLRRPLVLCYLHGKTRDEAAAELGVSESTLRGRLDRGKARLQLALERRGFPLAVGLMGTALSTRPLSAGSIAAVLRRALGPDPLPNSIQPLVTGVTPAMPNLKFWIVGVLAVGLLTVGGVSWLRPPLAAQSEPFTRLTRPDPKAGKVAEKLDGVWVARNTAPDGRTRRDVRMKFADDRTLVWELTHTQNDLPAPVVMTLKMRYEITPDGELKQEILEKWAGEDKLTRLSEADKKPRVWTMSWARDGKSFTLQSVPASDSPWATMAFTREADRTKPPADPLVPDSLTKIDRTISKLPKLSSDQPGYCLLAFGPKADFRVWVVLDGGTLYVDRNGNGDLTDDGATTFIPALSTPPKSYLFEVHGIGEANREKKSKLVVSTLSVGAAQPAALFQVVRDGMPVQKVGPTDFRFADTAENARVVHFDSQVLQVRPSLTMPSVLEQGKAVDFRVQVGTPGVGAGSFVSVGNDGLAKTAYPVAEFTFQPAKPSEKPIVLTVELTERCCGDQFFAPVTVPAESAGGRGLVTIRFPNCPLGTVTSFSGEVGISRPR